MRVPEKTMLRVRRATSARMSMPRYVCAKWLYTSVAFRVSVLLSADLAMMRRSSFWE